MASLHSVAGIIELPSDSVYHNEAFGYTLYEDVSDPANPEGPTAIGMHVPAHSMSKAWELLEPGYSERVELLEGSASLVVWTVGKDEFTTVELSPEDPTGDDIEISVGQAFCVVTSNEDAFVLSRPSKPFDKSYEKGLSTHPEDVLSKLILSKLVRKD